MGITTDRFLRQIYRNADLSSKSHLFNFIEVFVSRFTFSLVGGRRL